MVVLIVSFGRRLMKSLLILCFIAFGSFPIILPRKVYDHCLKYGITLHFAVEQLHTRDNKSLFEDIEMLIQSQQLICNDINYDDHINKLKGMI